MIESLRMRHNHCDDDDDDDDAAAMMPMMAMMMMVAATKECVTSRTMTLVPTRERWLPVASSYVRRQIRICRESAQRMKNE